MHKIHLQNINHLCIHPIQLQQDVGGGGGGGRGGGGGWEGGIGKY